MDCPKLTAQELRRRYRQGERHFANTNLSGESLRGLNLRGINLSGADLSHTDLRGTNFIEANLVEATLKGAKTGTQRRWVILKLLPILMLVALSSFLLASLWEYFTVEILLGQMVLAGFLLLSYWRGLLTTLSIAVMTIGLVLAAMLAGVISTNAALTVTITVSVIIVTTVVFAVTFAIAGILAQAFVVIEVFTAALASVFAVFFIGAFPSLLPVTIAVFVVILSTITTVLVAYLISRRVLQGDPRDSLVRDVAIWLASWGGTQFQGSDLTDADCTDASFKFSYFYGAILTRTRFHLARQVNLARLGKTILADFTVQELLITLRGRGKDYRGKNLVGTNLAGADLVNADFTEADLSLATLVGADLREVNFTKTQVLGTQFRQADLTGACLEAWNLDSTTQLTGAICEFVYLLNQQKERRPNSGSFQPGEFTKLFEEVLDTIDLIFQNGIDWKAFLQTFRRVQVEQEGAELAIQTIENKGDGVVVVKLQAAPETDKAAVHELFMSGYHTALQEAEARYKAQLDAKDDEIQYHRQQNANMQEVVKLLAAKPINIDVKAIAESKAMQGNDQSQNIKVGGDLTINAQNSVVSLREISGQVSNQISQLSTEGTADQPSLKELLEQLQQAVEADTELSDSDKVDALEEVGKLADAAKDSQEGLMQKAAKGAMNALKGIAAGLSETSKLAMACKDLLPLLKGIFGLP